jgi:hypothetical protein
MNVRVRYDPTVPAYVLRHRRTCGIFNPNANPRCVRLLRIIKYLAVLRSLVSCCKYLLFPLCHGNDIRVGPSPSEMVPATPSNGVDTPILPTSGLVEQNNFWLAETREESSEMFTLVAHRAGM